MKVLDRPLSPDMAPDRDPSQGQLQTRSNTPASDFFEQVLGIDLSLEVEPLIPPAATPNMAPDNAADLKTGSESLKQSEATPASDFFEQVLGIDLSGSKPVEHIKTRHKPSPARVKPAKHVKTPAPAKTPKPARMPSPDKIVAPKILSRRLAVRMGAVIAGPLVLFVGLTEGMERMRTSPYEVSASAAPAPEIKEILPTTVPTTEKPVTTVTTEAPVATTTEAPKPIEFKGVQPGEPVGVLSIPAICEDIQVIEYSEDEKVNDVIGSGAAVIDRLTPAEPATCENVEASAAAQEAQTNTDVITRAERTRYFSAPINSYRQVNEFQPVAGHEKRADGQNITVYPGQPGNSVIAGHGSTFSASFADLGVLQPGDIATFKRVDGHTYTYTMLNAELLPGNNDTPIREYTNPTDPNASTLTTYMCSDENGKTGGDANRYVVRWALTGRE